MIHITEQNFVDLLLHDDTREELFRQLEKEQGTELPLHNRISQIARSAICSEHEFHALQQLLLAHDKPGEYILGDLTFHPQFPVTALYELISLGKCLSEINHRSGPIELLLRLIELHDNCDEAIITVAKYYFASEIVSTETFKTFVEHHHDNEWLLSCLMHSSVFSTGKEADKAKAFYDIVDASPYAKELNSRIQELKIAEMLRRTQDAAIITKHYALQNPQYLRAISMNPHTPRAILDELVQVKGLKFSKEIRHNAHQILHKHSKGRSSVNDISKSFG